MADLYMYHFIETLINKALFLRDTKQFLKILSQATAHTRRGKK